MKTKKEILEETIAAYTRNTLAMENGSCQYLTHDGRMCAVGRCCENPQLDWRGSATELFDENSRHYRPNALKPEYRGHETVFWDYLQALHDDPTNWDENGLSERGKKHAELIRKRWDIPD